MLHHILDAVILVLHTHYITMYFLSIHVFFLSNMFPCAPTSWHHYQYPSYYHLYIREI